MNDSMNNNNRRVNRDADQAPSSELPSVMLESLEGDVTRMMEMLQKLRHRVNNDDLTGLLRRNEFFRRLDSMVSARGGEVSMILIDIDNFKLINDREGHVVGDHVLQRVSRVIQRCLKAGAEAGRFGGEEFVVAFAAGKERTAVLAEALRRQIQREVNVTVSVGVATARTADWEVRKMVGMADQALYQAKNAGKNQVCIAA
jgi:diguanylate cyclase (GGDEF)-like protein